MAGVDRQTDAAAIGDGFADTLELDAARFIRRGVGIGASVDFDHRCARCMRRIELRKIGIDEERNPDPGIRQPRAGDLHFGQLGDHIEPALGGEFLAFFRRGGRCNAARCFTLNQESLTRD